MRRILSLCTFLAASVLPSLAKADTYLFTFSAINNPAKGDFSFELPSSPTPAYVDPFGIYLQTGVIPITAGGQNILSITQWSNSGFSFDSDDYELTGATLFTGSISSPTFKLGSFAMTEYDQGPVDAGTLLISNITTPEPSSLWLLATGTTGLLTVLRRRRA